MIIELQNFGPIKSFKFDTDKDIHAIFGKNNIGKSYAISAVYLILKGLREQRRIEPNEYDFVGPLKLLSNHQEAFKYDSEEEGTTNFLKRTFISNLNKSFENTFDTVNIKNTESGNQQMKINILIQDFRIDIVFVRSSLRFIIENIKFGSYIIVDKNVTPNQIQLFDQNNILIEKKDFPFGLVQLNIFHFKVQFLRKIIEKEFENIFYLPASRSGLYNTLNSFGAIFAEISRNRHLLTSKFEIPNLTEPISDYFLNLNSIENTSISDNYMKEYEQIEKKILRGSIVFDNEAKKYFYSPNNSDMRLELSSTSSMISEIAPIIAHLKYIIPTEKEDKKSIFFIEEPEAHLHPEIQILLLEYFVKLSKGNLKIVMTSHSNYIFNKLSNLVIAKEISPDRLSVSLMKMTPEGSVVEEGDMQMDEYGIEDNNFVDVAEQLYEERMQLLENINS